MDTMARLHKLAELRAKTDRELVSVIENHLKLGLHLALPGEGKKSASARSIYAEALKLLPGVENTSERRRLERTLKQLRDVLDRASVPDELHAQAAS